MRKYSRALFAVAAVVIVATASGCGGSDGKSDSSSPAAASSVAPMTSAASSAPESSAAPTTSAAGSSAASAAGIAGCDPASLKTVDAGTFTVGTDDPAYTPWFIDNDPSSGKGYESAVAYAVAEKLGYTKDQVKWTKIGFDQSFAPGPKKFDVDLNQISITDQRKQAVDMSEGYYGVDQALVVLDSSPIKAVDSIENLKDFKFGAQIGSTSLTFITDTIKPSKQPGVYDTNDDAVAALTAHQIDGIIVDLPTGYYMATEQVKGAKLVGRFATNEQFGMVLQKDSPLTSCVDKALAEVKSSGELDTISSQYLSDYNKVPEIK